MLKRIGEECGVFGIFSQPDSDVAVETYFALYALQHRGQESAGIAVNNRGIIRYHRDIGLVPEVFNEEVLTERLGKGSMALGHTRYSKSNDRTRSRAHAQPMVVQHIKGNLALVHNGALTNKMVLREQLELDGAIFHSGTDAEVMGYVITKERMTSPSIEKAIEQAMYHLKGAYSGIVMSPTKMVAFRDPNGFRPLCMGKRGDDIIFASESCALDSVGASFLRDLEPGEIVVASEDKLVSIDTHTGQKSSMCVFEFVYFSRPDSIVEGASIHKTRLNAGATLYKEHPVEADVVIGAPDSGLDAALGFSRESGIPYGVGFIKNRYIDRTFINPTQEQREMSVKIKLNAVKDTVAGQRVVLVDDSIVRGTTSKWIVHLLKEAGATEVHMRISAPPFTNPCYFGTDIKSQDELIAHHKSIEEICEHIGADSLGYLSVEGMKAAAVGVKLGFCDGCFTGTYPIPVPAHPPSNKYEQMIDVKGEEN